ncbi:hypothetical protein T439DRAFT_333138 [Meredithblackwellia eburnea MCA 4105]
MPPWSYDSDYEDWDCDCGKNFKRFDSLQQHLEASNAHNYCSIRGALVKLFATQEQRSHLCPSRPSRRVWNAYQAHRANSSNHGWCVFCEVDHADKGVLNEHFHQCHSPCPAVGCSQVLDGNDGLHEHARQSHPYCVECRRIFLNHNNLNAHMNSSTHRPANIPCPLRNCGRMFISRAALVLHWESSTCKSGMTRQALDAHIRSHEAGRAVLNPRLLLTDSTNQPATTTYRATERAWNHEAQAYECYFCHSLFNSLAGLNQHLASPKHSGSAIKTYRCPNLDCRRELSTLSGLVQHIELGSCGVQRFDQVKNAMDALVRGARSLTI